MFRTFLVAIVAIAPTAAQDKKPTELRWYGHSMFQLTTAAGTKIVIDPHAIAEYGAPQLSPDLLLISHPHDDHNRKEVLANADSKTLKVLQGVTPKGKATATEWTKYDEKFKDVRARSVNTFHDNEEGAKRGKNAVQIVEADGLVFCHLGDLGHELTEEQIKEIGPVDVLMIPVGGIYTINGEVAKTVVGQLKPKLFVVPMHYGTKVYMDLPPADEFLDGQKKVDKLEGSNVLTIPAGMKAERPTVVILGWAQPKM
jgi:L-ascorbate metabolism protein UlaG (beta-lactamase superfamily)